MVLSSFSLVQNKKQTPLFFGVLIIHVAGSSCEIKHRILEAISVRLLGCDISPSHAAFVALDQDGGLVECRYTTEVKKIAALAQKRSHKSFKAKSYHLAKRNKREDKFEFQVKRQLVLYRLFREIIKEVQPTHVGIEGYAFSQRTGAYTIAEVTGMMKLIVYHLGIPLRIYQPGDIKLFMTGHGNAEKGSVHQAVKALGHDFEKFESEKVWYDLSDAFAIASLLRTEALLRVGRLQLFDLPQSTIRVFNRTTKSHPVNLLGREWIIRRDGS